MIHSSGPSERACDRLLGELAADTDWHGLPHTLTEVAQVVAGIALEDLGVLPSYCHPTEREVRAVASLVALSFGLEEYEAAGELAANQFLERCTLPDVSWPSLADLEQQTRHYTHV